MRLDKYLKTARIIKRRTVAKEVCDGGKVQINGRPGKAGTEVKTGDELSITLGSRVLQIRVLATPETIRASEAATLYEEIL